MNTDILTQIKENETILNKIGNTNINKPSSKGFLNLLDKFKNNSINNSTKRSIDFNTFKTTKSTIDRYNLHKDFMLNLELNKPMEIMELLENFKFTNDSGLEFLNNKIESSKDLKSFQNWVKQYITKSNNMEESFKISYLTIENNLYLCKIDNIKVLNNEVLKNE